MTNSIFVVEPDWPAPDAIRAAVTTRIGGVSLGQWRGLNLGSHVDDEPDAVVANRALIRESLSLPSEPVWLNQVHDTSVVEVPLASDHIPNADASLARQAGTVCAVMTADCLPLLLCDTRGGEWAAVHCGWRGLCGGIVAQVVSSFNAAPEHLLAWMGPAIGPASYQVGSELREAFVASATGPLAEQLAGAFAADSNAEGKYLADLYLLTSTLLQAAGVTAIYGGGFDTYSDPERFYSYRRDGQTGRFASLIWRE